MGNSINILAIESSCDETSAAVITDGILKSNIIASQIDIHKIYGGVVPEIASRNHLMKLPQVIDSALIEAGITLKYLDCIAVTYGPGLVGALLTGVSYAKALAYSLGIKLIGINHMAGHISACFIAGAKPPFICLVVSGGHTYIVMVNDYTDFTVLGSTRDDAAGEAFDKVARVVGLEYPGGPKLDKLSLSGNDTAVLLPRVMINEDNYDFSFSGVKSAVLNYINNANMKHEKIDKADLCASFCKSVCDVLVEKTIRAAKSYGIKSIGICGGVACNSLLRKMLTKECESLGYELFIPDKIYCSDNAAMIAKAAYYSYLDGCFSDNSLNAIPYLEL